MSNRKKETIRKFQFRGSALVLVCLFFFISTSSVFSIVYGSYGMKISEYDLKDFDSIKLSDDFSVQIFPSETFKVVVRCNDNLAPYLEVVKNGNTLELGLSNNQTYVYRILKAEIYMPAIKALEFIEDSEARISGFSGENLDVKLSSCARLEGDFSLTGKLNAVLSDSSEMELTGGCVDAELILTGRSEFDNHNFVVENKLVVNASGASTVDIGCNGEISTVLKGYSYLVYTGNCKVANAVVPYGSYLLRDHK